MKSTPHVLLRLVFTSDRIGVVIRSAQRYDQTVGVRSRIPIPLMTPVAYPVKTTLSESEAEAEE